MFLDRALREQKRISDEINRIEEQLQHMPSGTLTCACNGTGYKWYYTQDNVRVYLPKHQRKLAEDLAYKKYLELRLGKLKNEEKAIKAYLKIHRRNTSQREEKLLEHSEYQKLLAPHVANTRDEAMAWMNAPYKKNEGYKKALIHDTDSGGVVRSKAESMIESALRKHNIPYRYEEALVLGEGIYYPDFKLIHPRTGQIYWWEHAGRIDKPKYQKNFIPKLQAYISNGIFPTINLILTFETENNPLTTEQIEDVIEFYFEN